MAPFKAQNMSNNSVVTVDGGEIGRAQALQARACGLEPSVRFNPVLLKPGSDRRSQLVVRGRAVTTVGARDYIDHRDGLRAVVAEELASLRADFDAVICEGAGSPAEINLRRTDLANMGLARAADLPVVVVGDIDRGGVLAHLFGTLAVLAPEDQRLIAGFVVNKFRGDLSLLQPGLEQLATLTGRPTLGVLPYTDELWLDAEDSLGVVADTQVGRPGPPVGEQWLRVAAVRLPRISNSTDVEALACEPGVAVRWVDDASRLEDVDLIVLPGTKATVDDLEWLRRTGIGEAVVAHARRDKAVLGICGGYQMLGTILDDSVESGRGRVRGLGLLDLEIEYVESKTLARVTGDAYGIPVSGYEIHHGQVRHSGDAPLVQTAGGVQEGSVRGAVYGTHWHGLLENDSFRRILLEDVAEHSRRAGFVPAGDTDVAAVRAAQLDLLADLIEQHLDVDAVLALLDQGVPRGLPVVTSELRSGC